MTKKIKLRRGWDKGSGFMDVLGFVNAREDTSTVGLRSCEDVWVVGWVRGMCARWKIKLWGLVVETSAVVLSVGRISCGDSGAVLGTCMWCTGMPPGVVGCFLGELRTKTTGPQTTSG